MLWVLIVLLCGTSPPILSPAVGRLTLPPALPPPPPPLPRTRSPPTVAGTAWAECRTCCCIPTTRGLTCHPTKSGSIAVLRRSRPKTGRTSRTWWAWGSLFENCYANILPSLPNSHHNWSNCHNFYNCSCICFCFCICSKSLHQLGWVPRNCASKLLQFCVKTSLLTFSYLLHHPAASIVDQIFI